jgi:hypothetical protein
MLASPAPHDQPADTGSLTPLARTRPMSRTPPPRTFGELERKLLDLARANQEARNNARDGDKRAYSLAVDVRGLKRVSTRQESRGESIKVLHENMLSIEDLPCEHPLREYANDQGEFPLHPSGYYVPPTRWVDPTDAIRELRTLQRAGVRCELLGPCDLRIEDAAQRILGGRSQRALASIKVIVARWIKQGVAVRCGGSGVVLT